MYIFAVHIYIYISIDMHLLRYASFSSYAYDVDPACEVPADGEELEPARLTGTAIGGGGTGTGIPRNGAPVWFNNSGNNDCINAR